MPYNDSKPLKIAILGWGSLLWDKNEEFDSHHEEEWYQDGPKLKLEFSRVSSSRKGALTLVIDKKNGEEPCSVAYTFSTRRNPDDAICDLRCRENIKKKHEKKIGFIFLDGSRSSSRDSDSLESIRAWAKEKNIDVVIWTDLESNFLEKCGKHFSVDNAIEHIQSLDSGGKAGAVKYISRAPRFVDTPLRRKLESQSWFKKLSKELNKAA